MALIAHDAVAAYEADTALSTYDAVAAYEADIAFDAVAGDIAVDDV
jgi:hypothetical protein